MKEKSLLQVVQQIVHILFPKSRWGNVAYLIIGFVLANWQVFTDFISLIQSLF